MSKIFTVNLPDIGEGVVEGEVIEWLKKVNDTVTQDEAVVVVMTDKATVELPAPYPGVITQQYFNPGEIAIKDKPLYDITLKNGISIQVKEEASNKSEKRKLLPPCSAKAPTQLADGKALSTPPVRKLAKDLGINLAELKGSGREGRVTKDDLKNHVQVKKVKTQPFHYEGDELIPMIGIRKLTAERMSESKQTAPHFSYFDEVEVSRLVKLRGNVKKEAAKENIKLSFMPFIIRALSLCIKKFPVINSSVDQETMTLIQHKKQHIGIATDTKMGLVVPILKDVETLSFKDLIYEFDRLRTKTVENTLKREDMLGSTITISNFGAVGSGGLFATPIINFPEVAILAVNRIQKQPFVREDKIVARDGLKLSWSFDHRVIDGSTASAVSSYFAKLLENPAQIL